MSEKEVDFISYWDFLVMRDCLTDMATVRFSRAVDSAIRSADFARLDELIQRNCEPQTFLRALNSPLQNYNIRLLELLAEEGNFRAIEMLIENGVDTNFQCSKGKRFYDFLQEFNENEMEEKERGALCRILDKAVTSQTEHVNQ